MCAFWINTICLSIPSEEWVGIHYDLSKIQHRIYSSHTDANVTSTPSVLYFILKSWMYSAVWGVSTKWCNIHQSDGVAVKSVPVVCWDCGFKFSFTFILHNFLPLYLSLSLSYLPLPLINSHYHKNDVTACHTLPWATLLCERACVSLHIGTDSTN